MRAIALRALARHVGGRTCAQLKGGYLAHMRGEIAQEHLHVAARAHHIVNHIEHPRAVGGGDGGSKIKQKLAVGRAQRLAHQVLGQPFARAYAHIQQAPGVAHAAVGRAGNQRQRGRLGVLQLRQSGQDARGHLLLGQAAEIKPLAAGQDGGRDLLRLGGGQDEHHVGGRLLQRFEQGVEGGVGQHVHFVDDIHLVLAELRRVIHLFQQVADFLHAAVAGRVHLKHIQRCVLHQRLAGGARQAGIAVLRVFAVDGAGHDLGRAGFARATAAAEKIGMGDAPAGYLMPQRADDGLLTGHFGKSAGPPLAIQRLIHGCNSSCNDAFIIPYFCADGKWPVQFSLIYGII